MTRVEIDDGAGALPKHCTCISCGLSSRLVEAGGIWHCPNPLCRVCGAQWFRLTLDSYSEVDGGKHTVDLAEWLAKGSAALLGLPPDVVAAGQRCAERMRAELAEEDSAPEVMP